MLEWFVHSSRNAPYGTQIRKLPFRITFLSIPVFRFLIVVFIQSLYKWDVSMLQLIDGASAKSLTDISIAK